jgi:hypothetical protein
MIKDDKFINHTVRLDFNVAEADFKEFYTTGIDDVCMLDAATKLLACYGITGIKGLTINKI